MSDPMYTTVVHTEGGRAHGHATTEDGNLDVRLAFPTPLGGDGKGTNPEQLFGAAYGNCFTGTLGLVARNEGVALGQHSVDATVDLFRDPPTFRIGVTLTLNAPELDRARAEELLRKTHEICPYSKAIRGNVDVQLKVAQAA